MEPETETKEFNQMQLYLERLNSLFTQRDNFLIIGDPLGYYRATIAVLSNVNQRLIKKGIDTTEIKARLEKIGAKLRTKPTEFNKSIEDKNNTLFLEELNNLNTDLMALIFDSGLIFPNIKNLTYEESIEESY